MGGTDEGHDMARQTKDKRPVSRLIRRLRPSDLPKFRDHLLRLDPVSRHDRFNGAVGEPFITAYAQRSFARGTTVVGYIDAGSIRGAAEIHERPEESEPTAEIAFSVESEFQGRGIGALMFERLLAHARGMGYLRLRVTTHPENGRMRRLARKFNASLSFQAGETVAIISLEPLPAIGVRNGRLWRSLRVLGLGGRRVVSQYLF
jgi:RimJ/RimL family protein N-acetyltransferase